MSALRRISTLVGAGFLGVAAHAASLDSLSQDLARGISSMKNKKVAVLAFPYHDGKTSSGSSIISERLTTLLVGKRGIRVIERRLIQQLLAEKKLDETGAIDPEDLKTVGSILNVDAIVIGTLIDLNKSETEINARMIQVASGEIVAAAQETIERTWKDDPASPRAEKKAGLPPPAPVVKRAPPPEPPMEAEQPAKKLAIKSTRLTNENFAPGRRRYLSSRSASTGRSRGTTRSYDSAYESGYAESYEEAAWDAPKSSYDNKNYGTTYAPPMGVQHPYGLGTVRSETSPRNYYDNYPTSRSSSYRQSGSRR